MKPNNVALYFLKLPQDHAHRRDAHGPSSFEQTVFLSLTIGWIALAIKACTEHEFGWLPIVAVSAIPALGGVLSLVVVRNLRGFVELSDDNMVVADGTNINGLAPRLSRRNRKGDVAGWASIDGDLWISGSRVPWDLVHDVSIDNGPDLCTFKTGFRMLESPGRLGRLRRFNNIFFCFRLALIAAQAVAIGLLIRSFGLRIDVIAASLNVISTFIVAQGLYRQPWKTLWTGLPGVLQMVAFSPDPNMSIRDYLARYTEVLTID